jgi:hypothetical protein
MGISPAPQRRLRCGVLRAAPDALRQRLEELDVRPESIAEVTFKVKPGKFEMDQYLRVKGKLKLNEANIEHGNFLLEDAVLVSK